MKVYQASILFSALLAVTSCHSKSFKIQGSTQGIEDGDTLYLTRDMESGMPSDTLIVKDGQFTLSGEADSTTLCMVYCAKRNEINAPFFMEPGNITIRLTDQPGGSRVGGTTCNDQWQVLNDSVMVIGKEINRIAEHIYGNNVPQEEQQKGMQQIERLNQRFAALVVKKAEANIDNEFGYFLLTYYPEELIDNANRSRLIKLLPAKMRQRQVIQQMEQMLQAAAKTAEGAVISDFTQNSLKGEELSLLSEVTKNRLTIIDFWASWCGPCRQEMPFMIHLYDTYQPKGLGIVGISLDSDRDAWQMATDKFGIKWPQMSDLKGWENEIAKHFNVTSIPHTIVVDQQGKILRRGLRGEQLEQFIQQQLK